MSIGVISFDIGTTDANAELSISIWIDHDLVYENSHVKDMYKFSHAVNDNDATHELRIVMSGKTALHTKINQDGHITKDACLTVRDPKIDDIEVAQLFNEKTVYTHNFNGTQSELQHKFYGNMGCNGTVSLQFSTPIYLWMLENI
jgi:hypothetical protein